MRCDVSIYVEKIVFGVLDHPYFAVTGVDSSFSIPDVPPSDYVVEVWHERFGTQEINVTVGEKETADASFTFTASE